MKQAGKKKLCWNCEGNVSLAAENCPYCGVYLSPLETEDSPVSSYQMVPPYPVFSQKEEEKIPEAPYASEPQDTDENRVVSKQVVDFKASLIPLVFLLSGTVFFLFSFILYLFSDHGHLTLQWDTTYWFVYLFASFVMLTTGWIALHRLGDVPEEK